MAEVRLENISKKFGKDVWAVREISLAVKDTEFMVLLGPSGCGKTTILRIISGLEEPTRGKIYIGGKQVNDVLPKDRGISMVFQSYAVWPHMKVYENIAFGLVVKRVSKGEIERRVQEVANLVKIKELLNRYPGQLSGGQKQRVALARALVVKPEVFLMDEPLSNLDALLRAKMRTDLKHIHKRVQATTVFVTHDQSEAMSMADRISVVKDGQIEQIGTPEEVYFKPSNIFVANFIGSPTMNMLEMEIREREGLLYLVSPCFKLLLTPECAGKVKRGNLSKVVLGIRPEDISCLPEGKGNFNAEVFVIEPQGSQQIVALKLENGIIIKSVVKSEVVLKPGQTIPVSFNCKKLHLFNRDTGKRIN